MTQPTVPEPSGFRAVAAELYRIADSIRDLPSSREKQYVTIAFLPSPADATSDQKIADVDMLATAILDMPGKTIENSLGQWMHVARSGQSPAGVWITVQESVPSPHEMELERLRARVAELESAVETRTLIDETPTVHLDRYGNPIPADEICVASLHIPTPGEWCGWCGMEGMRSGQHIEVSAAGDGSGCSAECACGVTVRGFDTWAEARAELGRHIADASTVEPVAEAR